MRSLEVGFLLLFLALGLCVRGEATNERCPSSVSLGTVAPVSEAEPFGRNWARPERFLSNFKPFSRILTLADGETLEHSREIARFYPDKQVIGSDVEAILPSEEGAPEYREDLKTLPNLTVAQIDVTRPIDLPDGAVELVFLYAGLCHCKSLNFSCCGVSLDDASIARFLKEVWRLVDKSVPHSMAVLHGYLPDPFGRQWLNVCTGLEKETGFQCVPMMGPRASLWGFNLKQRP